MDRCGAQTASPYAPSVGCIRACPYGHAHIGPMRTSPYGHTHKGPMWGSDSKSIWAQCGMYSGLPIWVPFGKAHKDPCGAQIASPYGPSVGYIRACPYEQVHKGPSLLLNAQNSMI